MTKKKVRGTAKRSTTKKTRKRTSTRVVRASAAAASNRTAAATIFVYEVAGQTRVRTSPQLLGAGPGSIEWTVVNLASDAPVDVDITWHSDSPWGGREPIKIKGGNYRRSLVGARDGRYKYNVTVNGFTEDPEIEIPGN
jgi:hypothetical protein